jgi:hypothetical protein
MTRPTIILLLCTLPPLAALALLGGGCKGDSSDYTLQHGVEQMFGVDDEAPEEIAAKAFDESDPDMRRTAIEQLSNKRWALRDPYLKRFAMLSQEKHEKDPSVRAVAVRTLGRARNSKYKPQILLALADSAPVVRWDAAVVMQRWPDDEAVLRLQQLAIQDESVDVRAAAVTALQHYRTDSVYRTMLRALDDDEFTVRQAAHDALVAQTGMDKGYDPLNWVGDPDRLGQETLPEPTVRYRKRPWWDWMKVTDETEAIQPAARQPAPASQPAATQPAEKDRPWWDWFGTTDEE